MNNNTQFAEFSFNPTRLGSRQSIDGLPHTTIKAKPQHSAWGAFQAGMQILQNYGGRSPANSETIAKANLRLLHRSLLNDPCYVQSLKYAKNKTTSNSFPISHCIYNNKGFRADLITLKSRTTILLNTHQNNCAMYLAISGKPTIQASGDLPPANTHWWDRYRYPQQGESFKNGDTMFVSPNKTKKRLTAEKKECVLLRIQLPNR